MEEKKNELSFEENLEQLSKIVEKLETGEIPLDDAICEFQKATLLAKSCDEKLKSAEDAICKMVKDSGELEDFEISE